MRSFALVALPGATTAGTPFGAYLNDHTPVRADKRGAVRKLEDGLALRVDSTEVRVCVCDAGTMHITAARIGAPAFRLSLAVTKK